MKLMRILVVLTLLVSLPLCLGPICRVQDGDNTPDGDDGTDGGDTGPQAGGQGIAQGRYTGSLNCTDTVKTVSDGQETVVSTSPRNSNVVREFNADGLLLVTGNQPVSAGTELAVEVAGGTGTNTIQSVSKSVDRLVVVGSATATVNVPGKGDQTVIGAITEVYQFSEPDTVTVTIEDLLTSNPVEGTFTKVTATCSASLTYAPL
jgi:hypothetical protein